MNLKKIGCVAAAAAVAMTVFALPASAASTKKLLVEPAATVDEKSTIWHIGDSLYATSHGGWIGDFYSITDNDRKSWQETGEFSYSKVNVDGELSTKGSLTTSGNCLAVVNDDTIMKRYAYDFNGTDTLTITYETENWLYVRDDGYMVEYTNNADELVITVISPDGEKNEAVLETALDPNDETRPFWWYLNCGLDDYPCVVCYVTEWEYVGSDEEYGDVYNYTLNLDLIEKDGSVKNAWTCTMQYSDFCGAFGDYVIFEESSSLVKGASVHIYNTSTGELSNFSLTYGVVYGEWINSDGQSIDTVEYYSLDTLVWCNNDDGKAIVQYVKSDDSSEYVYALVDLSNNGEAVSGFYKTMHIIDGELFLVQTADDKWGYINSDGELLKTFDDAGDFYGKYAPVVNDGKAYLINKNMQRVSEKIDAESVWTLGKGLYGVKIDGKNYFMTYTDVEDDSAAETPDENAAQPETPDDTDNDASVSDDTTVTDSVNNVAADDVNPDTGAESGIVFAAIAAVSAGAIVLSGKRRR